MREGVSFHSSSTWPTIGVSSPPDYRRVLSGTPLAGCWLSFAAGVQATRNDAICRRKSADPPLAGCRTQTANGSWEAARRPTATTRAPVKRLRNTFRTGSLAPSSAWVGMRLLSMPRRGANECQGNTFHRTNSLPRIPWPSRVLQTMLAVGSEKPRGALSNLLVRRGLIAERTLSGGTSEFPPKRIRSEVMAMPVKCPPR